jgi:hypothetical protein
MDELDLIRSFRSDIPAPSAAAIGRAERAWRRGRPRRRWAPRLVMAGALAAAALIAAIAIPGTDTGRLGPAEATAAGTLRRAADAQRGELPRPLRPGEFWYVRIRSDTLIGGDVPGGYTAVQPQVREDWVAPDGTRRSLIRPAGPLRFPGPRDRARWEADGRPPLAAGGREDYRFKAPRRPPFSLGDARMSYADLLALPREADTLYARLRAAAVECECGHNVNSETFTIVEDTLVSTPIPDDLRAAFLRAAALIPGIELVARERDVTGRPAVAVAYDYAGHREALLFDRDSYTRLGDNHRLVRRVNEVDAAPGELLGGRAYVESGIVSSQFARP